MKMSMATTTWKLLAQLDLLHQLQPPTFKDDEWEYRGGEEDDEDELEPAQHLS
jgi:hypothetical protein